MTRRRFFATPESFNSQKQVVTLSADETRHLRDVLRLKPGDIAFVFDGTGKEFRCLVSEVGRNSAELKVQERIETPGIESPLHLTIAIGLLKGEKFDLVVQKATELGVTSIIPLSTRYADIHLRDNRDAEKRVARWQRIAIEATKQSGRTVVPKVSLPQTFNSLVNEPGDSCRFLFAEREGKPLAEAVAPSVQQTNITALVGPEGGWASEELTQARDAGWQVLTVGGRILRAETAAIVISALLEHIYGDLR